jgi:siroheme synthase-like protein
MQKDAKTIFPASLLVEGKPCLIVGGGKVANRKARTLTDALAHVTVIAPEICEGLEELVSNNQIEYVAREFDKRDIKEQSLVFAATNNEQVNNDVLEACRDTRVLCCCIDGNWRNGDFVSPASFRHNGITISVSTGGRSCVEARDIKNAILEFLKNMEEMTDDTPSE